MKPSPIEILKSELRVNSETTLEEMDELSYYPIFDICIAMKSYNKAFITDFIEQQREKGVDHILLNELSKEINKV